jgi:ubiquinone/menaquinone biosynthesis C-methylase UbiE
MQAIPDQKQSVQDQFGPVAAHYGTAGVHRAGPDLEAMLPAAGLRGDERVLDVGCGGGHTALAFAPHVAEVVALDLTEAMLKETRRLAEERQVRNVSTQIGDVEALPFDAARFDVVTCRLCAHHFKNPGRALAEIARVLVPGGQLILVDIISPETPLEDTFLNTIEILRDPSHVRDHSISDWLRMFGAVGFAPELLSTWSMPQAFKTWVERIGATSEAIRALETAFTAASSEARASLAIQQDLGFSFQNALFRGRLI